MDNTLAIGDTHCPAMRKGYVDFLQRVSDRHGCNHFVHIGDAVDWASISFHEKSPALLNASREFKEAKRQVQSLARAFPKAEWLIGNHDALTERKAVSIGLPLEVLKDYADLWEIDWKVHPRFGSVTIDGVEYSHGETGSQGKMAAINQAKDNFCSRVIGHLHGQAGVTWWANPEYRVFGASTGCGIDASRLQFEYGRRFTAKPILGCVVVLGGKRAIFEPWLLKSK